MWHKPCSHTDRAFTEGSEPRVIVVIMIIVSDISWVPALCQALCSAKAAGTIFFNLHTDLEGS